MWFKNLIIYRLPEGWSIPTVELESRLSNRPLQAPNSFEMFSRGWVHSSVAQRYVHHTNGQYLIALGVEQKLLPSSIIKQVAVERAEELAQQQGFPVGRRQMRELKEKVTEELRARALSRRRITRAWIDTVNGWFIVDAAGGARADELVETLRDTLGSLPVQFTLGTQSATFNTNASGEAMGTLALDQAPGDVNVQAHFPGSREYAPSTEDRLFTVQPEDAGAKNKSALFTPTASPASGVATVRLRANLTDWCVKNDWFATTANDCRLMHCLPVRRNTAVADEVLDGPRSVVQREAYNRLVVQMAVLYKLLKGS